MKRTILTTLALSVTLLATSYADAGSFRRGGSSRQSFSRSNQRSNFTRRTPQRNLQTNAYRRNVQTRTTTQRHHFGNTKQNVRHNTFNIHKKQTINTKHNAHHQLNHHHHTTSKFGVHKHHNHHNYHVHYGKKFKHGFYYHGKNHHHWTKTVFIAKYGCNCHWCPSTQAYYYWCAPHGCYYPVSYCPTGVYTN